MFFLFILWFTTLLHFGLQNRTKMGMEWKWNNLFLHLLVELVFFESILYNNYYEFSAKVEIFSITQI